MMGVTRGLSKTMHISGRFLCAVCLVVVMTSCGARTDLRVIGRGGLDAGADAAGEPDTGASSDARSDSESVPYALDGDVRRDVEIDVLVDAGDADLDAPADGDAFVHPLVSTCDDPVEEVFELVGELDGVEVGHRYCRQGCAEVRFRSEGVFMRSCAFGTYGLVHFAGPITDGSSYPVDLAVMRMPLEGPMPAEVYCAGAGSSVGVSVRPFEFELDPLERACTTEDPAGNLVLDIEPGETGSFSGSIEGVELDIDCDHSGRSDGYLACGTREGSPLASLFLFTDPEVSVVEGEPVPVDVALLFVRTSESEPYEMSCTRTGSFVEYHGEESVHAELDSMSSFRDFPSPGSGSYLEGAYLDGPE